MNINEKNINYYNDKKIHKVLKKNIKDLSLFNLHTNLLNEIL